MFLHLPLLFFIFRPFCAPRLMGGGPLMSHSGSLFAPAENERMFQSRNNPLVLSVCVAIEQRSDDEMFSFDPLRLFE